jgi:hypothetical protein
VTGEQDAVLIEQYGGGKSDRLNAVGNLADLFFRMCAWVARMGLDLIKCDRRDRTNVRPALNAARLAALPVGISIFGEYHNATPIGCGVAFKNGEAPR